MLGPLTRDTVVAVPGVMGVAVAQSTSVGGAVGARSWTWSSTAVGCWVVTTAKYVPGATLRASARTLVAPPPDPHPSSVDSSAHAPSMATATSGEEVEAHTSRATLAPGGTVMAA